MEGLELKETKVKATVIHNRVDNVFTIFLDGANGPIISESSLEKAKEKFEEAMKVAVAARNFRYFTQAVKAIDKDKAEFINKIRESNSVNSIEYLEEEFTPTC